MINHHFLNEKNKRESKEENLTVYATNLNTKDYPFILDHRLNHIAIAPASWYLDTAFLIGLEKFNTPFKLSEILYPKALLLNGSENYPIRLEIRKQNEKIICEFYAAGSESEEKFPCARCSIEKIPEHKVTTADIPSMINRCQTKLNREEFYIKIAGDFLNFGPLHQGVETIYVGKDEAIGSIKKLDQLKDDKYLFHPSFLDIFSHIGLSLIDKVPAGELLVTASQNAFELYAPLPDETWCYAKVTHREKNEISLDVSIYSTDGTLVGKVINYRLKSVSQFQVFPQLYEYFTFGWEEQPLRENTEAKKNSSTLLITDDPSILSAFSGKETFKLEEKDKCALEVSKDPANTAVIVYIKPQDDIYAGNLFALSELLELIKKFNNKEIIQLHRLIVLTKSLPLSQAGIPGFCQVVNQEAALFKVQHIDLKEIDAQTFAHIGKELSVDANEQRISYQGNRRLVYRMLPIQESKPAHINPDGAYLITGGLGGIGHAVTDWLVKQGAKKVVLLNRSAPSEAQMQSIKSWNQVAEIVQTMQCDVSDVAKMKEIVSGIHNHPYPIKGIFHAAGVNRDNTLNKLTKEDFEIVFKPKILGTLALAKATEGISLEHFVLFSSVTAFLGTSGVANYAAANSFLDEYALSKGAKSINWGPWEKGLLSKLGSEVKSFWEHQGFKVLTDDEGTMRLGKAMGIGTPQVAVMPVNWYALFKEYATNTKITTLKNIMSAYGYRQTEFTAKTTIVDDLKSADEADRKSILADFIISIVQDVTGTEESDTSLPFNLLGIDSITSVEMTKRLQNIFIVPLPPTLLYNYPSVDYLADYLLAEKLKDIYK